jgi:hypothetical protein
VLHRSEFVALNDAGSDFAAVLVEFRYEEHGRTYQAVRSVGIAPCDLIEAPQLAGLVEEAERYGAIHGVTVSLRITGERSRRRSCTSWSPVPPTLDAA